MFDAKKVMEDAKKELVQEKEKALTKEIKAKLTEIDKAEEVVRRLQLELSDIMGDASV